MLTRRRRKRSCKAPIYGAHASQPVHTGTARGRSPHRLLAGLEASDDVVPAESVAGRLVRENQTTPVPFVTMETPKTPPPPPPWPPRRWVPREGEGGSTPASDHGRL